MDLMFVCLAGWNTVMPIQLLTPSFPHVPAVVPPIPYASIPSYRMPLVPVGSQYLFAPPSPSNSSVHSSDTSPSSSQFLNLPGALAAPSPIMSPLQSPASPTFMTQTQPPSMPSCDLASPYQMEEVTFQLLMERFPSSCLLDTGNDPPQLQALMGHLNGHP
ncbi:hypothetical protein BT69DRAFT_1282130 [Atractiella rhizophila]|nr:hypothetical protein BT69DRAFT_1282130 [Atractiella rhizophila]